MVAGDCDDGVRQAIAIEIIELRAKAGERNPDLLLRRSGEFSRARANVGIEEPLTRPACCLSGAFPPFRRWALIKEGSRSPRPCSDSGGVLVLGCRRYASPSLRNSA
jgi:hypothetical protein